MGNELIEILKLLIERKEERLSIRRIALLRKVNYKSAYNALMQLQKQGIVNLEKTGNTTICKFNEKFNDLVFKAEFERRGDLLKNKNFWVIHDQISKLNFPFIVLLFGSYAKGTATKNSDIDLLIISKDDEEKIFDNLFKFSSNNIHLTQINYNSFVQMIKSKELSVVGEALKKNIILVGIEDYYRLLENVR